MLIIILTIIECVVRISWAKTNKSVMGLFNTLCGAPAIEILDGSAVYKNRIETQSFCILFCFYRTTTDEEKCVLTELKILVWLFVKLVHWSLSDQRSFVYIYVKISSRSLLERYSSKNEVLVLIQLL